MPEKLIIRLVSSKVHGMSRGDLAALIRSTGTDKYDKERKQIFDDFYGKHEFDFFGSEVDATGLEDFIREEVEKFPERTFGDRKIRVVPDVVIIYDANKCRMIKNIYDYQESSDCYQFITDPKGALYEVREIDG